MSLESGRFMPKRGMRSTAINQGLLLKRGEVYFEVPESGVGTGSGKIIMGDGLTSYENLPYFTEGGAAAGTVTSVNNVKPDVNGNIDLNSVPYAENILAPTNIHQQSSYIFRTSGGETNIESGNASLNSIRGNCVIEGGTIKIARPTAFKSIGLNQFDKTSMVINNCTISSAGAIIPSMGNYVCYVHAVGGLTNGYIIYDPSGSINKVAWYGSIPTASSTNLIVGVDNVNVSRILNNPVASIINTLKDGYICISCTNCNKLTVHPKWSGTADTKVADYTEFVIDIPTKDINNVSLPTAKYGFPAINDVRDELSFGQRTYTQRIGQYPYSTANLALVVSMGVAYMYDTTNIFYVLPNPIVFRLKESVKPTYVVDDYGTEEFIGTTLPIYTNTVYGENLRDKLRLDVVTLTEQEFTDKQKLGARTNIDAAQDHLEFKEADDTENIALLNTIISGNPMSTLIGASKRLMRRLDSQLSNKVSSVNHILPDEKGAVIVNKVPLADNLYSESNKEFYAGYLYRTSGGSADVNSGEAQLSYIRGSMTALGRIVESITATIVGTGSGEEYVYPTVTVDANVWRKSSLGSASGTYEFVYNGHDWTYNSLGVKLSDYGISVKGTITHSDTITVNYVAANRGVLQTLKPISFVSTGLNQFDSSSMVVTGYTIDETGKVVAEEGSYIAYCRAPYAGTDGYIAYDPNSSIERMGFNPTIPSPGDKVDLSEQGLSTDVSTYIVPETSTGENTGFICVACTNISNLCIHAKWSGFNDTVYEAYTKTEITLPVEDTDENDLPYIEYGLPAVESISDEINFDLKQYIQRIGHYPYNATNLDLVEKLGVPYDYDSNHIFYVLPSYVIYQLPADVSGKYTVNDYGFEYFTFEIGLGTKINGNLLYSDNLYGQNLRDKLRRDVLTISAQALNTSEKTQVLSNIGAAAANHTHTASDIVGGSLEGKLVADSTSAAELSESQVRNIIISNIDLVDGVSDLPTGTIYIVYEDD